LSSVTSVSNEEVLRFDVENERFEATRYFNIIVSILLVSRMESFVDREKELDFLAERFGSDSFELILLYGRRRVGKTELVKKASEDRDSIYHLVVEEEGSRQLDSLVDDVSEKLGGFKPDIDDWSNFFEYFCSEVEDSVLIIDEFPRLIEEDGSVPSRFQKFVDEHLKQTSNKLVLTGSSIGMMQELMSYENPLYGRRTGQIDLHPFDFENSRKMIDRSIVEQIRFYSVFGGTPFYLQQLSPKKSLKENIELQVCSQNSVLYEEPRMLVKQEFRKPGRYLSILESVASGKTSPKTIADDTDIPIQSISKYLNQLEKIRLVEHSKPVTERNKRSRNGIYRLNDNFFDFWFRYIYPNLSDASESPENFVKTGLANIEEFYGKKFESVCRELVSKNNDYGKVGGWWYKEDEIDVVAIDEEENRILFGEAKWRNRKTGVEVLESLKEKSDKVRWRNDKRKEEYVLFSKSGFTEELKNRSDEYLRLYNLEKISETL
jgi:AAA+ ATPase superfamily predicted ATPase